MELQGITIDFSDRRTCGLLPHLCLQWDEKFDELDDNEELINYWESNLKKITDKTDKIVCGNIEAKSMLYSADPETITLIKETFKEIQIEKVNYSNVIKCDHCLVYDYLDKNFKRK